VASFAFEAYKRNRARTFELQSLIQSVGPEVSDALLAAGLVKQLDAKLAYFSHHLIHDYLAARHVAAMPSNDWTRQTLNVISFDRSSFDVVASVLGVLEGPPADLFLRALYDWDLYAAGYSLAEAVGEEVGPAREMRIVIFAMLAEKRFDIVSATQQRANDALLIARTADAIPYRDAGGLDEVIAATGLLDTQVVWFNEWRRLFSTPQNQAIGDEDLTKITDLDSVKGWTVANVVKRTSVSDQQQARLRGWLARDDAVIRWRVVHALGSFPSDENFASLLHLLDEDPDVDVRYGSVRSIVEMACRSGQDLRERIFAEIGKRVRAISAYPRVEAELERALLVSSSKAPEDWPGKAKALARELFQVADDVERRDKWRAFVDKVEVNYVRER
jgi:hypothetical protein